MTIKSKVQKEIWKPIKGYEGIYEVSNFGRVKSLDRIVKDTLGRSRFHKGEIKSQRKNNKGYFYVNLNKSNKYKSKTVHRLVALHFVEGKFNKAVVNHKDENPTNNASYNLEWTTQYKNSIYGSALNSKKKPVIQFNKNRQIIRRYESAKSTKQLGFNPGNVSQCCRGEKNVHRGYYWEYENEQKAAQNSIKHLL